MQVAETLLGPGSDEEKAGEIVGETQMHIITEDDEVKINKMMEVLTGDKLDEKDEEILNEANKGMFGGQSAPKLDMIRKSYPLRLPWANGGAFDLLQKLPTTPFPSRARRGRR